MATKGLSVLDEAFGRSEGKDKFADITGWKDSSAFPWWQMKLGTLSFACLCGPPYMNCDVYELPVDPSHPLPGQREIGVAANHAATCAPSTSSAQLPAASTMVSSSTSAHDASEFGRVSSKKVARKDGAQKSAVGQATPQDKRVLQGVLAAPSPDGVQLRTQGAFVEAVPQALFFAKPGSPEVKKQNAGVSPQSRIQLRKDDKTATDASDVVPASSSSCHVASSPDASGGESTASKVTADTSAIQPVHKNVAEDDGMCARPSDVAGDDGLLDMLPVGETESFIAASSSELEAIQSAKFSPVSTSMEDVFG